MCNWDTTTHCKHNNCVKVALCQIGANYRFFFLWPVCFVTAPTLTK